MKLLYASPEDQVVVLFSVLKTHLVWSPSIFSSELWNKIKLCHELTQSDFLILEHLHNVHTYIDCL